MRSLGAVSGYLVSRPARLRVAVRQLHGHGEEAGIQVIQNSERDWEQGRTRVGGDCPGAKLKEALTLRH